MNNNIQTAHQVIRSQVQKHLLNQGLMPLYLERADTIELESQKKIKPRFSKTQGSRQVKDKFVV